MASATMIQLSQPETVTDHAVEWAIKLRPLFALLAPYDNFPDEVLDTVTIDESVMNAPRRRAADNFQAVMAEKTAELLYPAPDHSLGSIIKYEKDIVKLRNFILQQRKRAIEVATARNDARNWNKRIINQGPWNPADDPVSLDGAPSLPMPVDIAEPDTLAPFFEHLRDGGTEDIATTARAAKDAVTAEEPYYGIQTLEFGKGVVYSDRRMDLCKMVLGPTNIGALIESLKTNEFITHFLLGNNLIGPHGAKCIADFLKEYPNRMDTWYLAGNCIDTDSFKLLVDQWINSSSVTNIWLKRNPLGPSSAHDIFRLITQAPNLRTLDLDQTELGDAGVTELFSKLAKHDKPLSLRHIYLNAVGVGPNGATAIGDFLASPHCLLESLYASNNPVGSLGAEAIAAGLWKNKSMTRLALSSVGMLDDGAIALCEALQEHPHFMMLDIGQNFATKDLGSRYNWITDRSADAIHNLIVSSKIAFLNIGSSAVSNAGLNNITEAILKSSTIVLFTGRTIWPQSKEAVEISERQKYLKLRQLAQEHLIENVKRKYGEDYEYAKFMEDEKRWLVSDKEDVRKIDSVYRNRDAGLARRGLKQLEKWWDEDDETLEQVMKATGPICTMKAKRVGAIGPVCTMRKQQQVA